MVLVRDRSPEEREDAVAGRLHDITVVAMGGVHHQLERGIDHRARLLGIEILHHLGGSFDVGEQRRDGLPLTVGGCRVDLVGNLNCRIIRPERDPRTRL
jgi:hypothetical protein